MAKPIRVMLLGTGQMGSAIGRLMVDRPELALVAVCAHRPGRAGLDAGAAIGLERELGITVENDLEGAIERTRPEVAIQATGSTLEQVQEELITLLRHGVRVVTIAEEMAYPAARSPEAAAALDRLAKGHGTALIGTGINPGFLLDTLVVTLASVCSGIRAITATRVNDLSPYGPTVLADQGVGLGVEAFARGVADGSVVGHHGFPQSIGLIGSALGWEIERIDQRREPIVSTVRRETPFVTVEPGQVAGCLHTAVAYRQGRPAITLIHPQQVRPELEGIVTGDTIEIDATPPIRLAGSPEIPGGEATAALAVNLIPRILAAPPGLRTMIDLPLASRPPAKL